MFLVCLIEAPGVHAGDAGDDGWVSPQELQPLLALEFLAGGVLQLTALYQEPGLHQICRLPQ